MSLADLTMMQCLSVVDPSTGALRCPCCGKFRKDEDFGEQETCLRIPGGVVCMGAECRFCAAARSKETP